MIVIVRCVVAGVDCFVFSFFCVFFVVCVGCSLAPGVVVFCCTLLVSWCLLLDNLCVVCCLGWVV